MAELWERFILCLAWLVCILMLVAVGAVFIVNALLKCIIGKDLFALDWNLEQYVNPD